ncbi:MAG: GtrA family protein [Ramlibacter sp.]|nr:GtrA family protein [Ramlibacter sp.]
MRKIFFFGVIGIIQLLVDALIFYLLMKLSLSPWISNSTSRFLALLLGFVLNGAFTFRRGDNSSTISKKSFFRLLILWAALTLISSELVTLASLHVADLRLIAAKLTIEFLLAFVSFLISKKWVYR